MRQVNYYNELALFDTDRLTPTTVRTMLERNVQAAPPLAAVRDRELFEIARGGAPLGLAQYVALLKSPALTMDIKQSRLRRAQILLTWRPMLTRLARLIPVMCIA